MLYEEMTYNTVYEIEEVGRQLMEKYGRDSYSVLVSRKDILSPFKIEVSTFNEETDTDDEVVVIGEFESINTVDVGYEILIQFLDGSALVKFERI